MNAKRRLPLVQSAAEGDGDPKRSGWQWVAFGTIAIFVLWLPLSALALRLAARVAGGAAATSGPVGPETASSAAALLGASLLALALSALGGGFTVGRWGGEGVGVREAALGGLMAALVAITASWLSYGIALAALFIVIVAVPFAGLGGKLGVSRRHRPSK